MMSNSCWGCVLLLLAALLSVRAQKTNQVLVLTQGRSGSTFVGELLSKIPGSIYLYEPCRSLTITIDPKTGDSKFGEVDEEKCQRFLANLLDCSITANEASALFSDWVAISKCNMKSVVDLAPKRISLDSKVHGYNTMCSKSPLRIIKEIRLVTPGQLIEKREQASILHLVRDVRAVVNSRLVTGGFCLHKGAPGCARPICEEMDATFKGTVSVRSSPRYRLIRFEDVCDNPVDMSKQIYQWLGFPLLPDALQWIESSTNAPKGKAPEGAGKYGTSRSDPSQVAHGWETTLGVPEMTKINDVCGAILQSLGYDLLGPLERAQAAVAASHQGVNVLPPPSSAKSTATTSVAAVGHTSPTTTSHQSSSSTSAGSHQGGREPWWKQNARLKREKALQLQAKNSKS